MILITFDSVFTAEALRVLSNNEFTDSLQIYFRFLRSPWSFNLLTFQTALRIITRRYANYLNLQNSESSGTNGRNSGGITGTTFHNHPLRRFSRLEVRLTEGFKQLKIL
jgi:hypothetical protein